MPSTLVNSGHPHGWAEDTLEAGGVQKDGCDELKHHLHHEPCKQHFPHLQ